MILHGRVLEVYANGQSACDPIILEPEDVPTRLLLSTQGTNKLLHAEFQRFRLWPPRQIAVAAGAAAHSEVTRPAFVMKTTDAGRRRGYNWPLELMSWEGAGKVASEPPMSKKLCFALLLAGLGVSLAGLQLTSFLNPPGLPVPGGRSTRSWR